MIRSVPWYTWKVNKNAHHSMQSLAQSDAPAFPFFLTFLCFSDTTFFLFFAHSMLISVARIFLLDISHGTLTLQLFSSWITLFTQSLLKFQNPRPSPNTLLPVSTLTITAVILPCFIFLVALITRRNFLIFNLFHLTRW